MSFLSILLTGLLVAPPFVVAVLWRVSRRQRSVQVGRRRRLPDREALVLARVGAVTCGLLPSLQMLASFERWRTGEAGLYLWYLLAGFGVVLAIFALAALLSYARGKERGVSSGMVVLATSMLLLITFLGGPGAG